MALHKPFHQTQQTYAALVYWTKVKQAIDRTPDIVRARAIYKRVTVVDTEASTAAYTMATEQLDTMDLEETRSLAHKIPIKWLNLCLKPPKVLTNSSRRSIVMSRTPSTTPTKHSMLNITNHCAA